MRLTWPESLSFTSCFSIARVDKQGGRLAERQMLISKGFFNFF